MLQSFKNMLRRSPTPQAAVPDGMRVYAIGDIHGQLALFDALIEAIEDDQRSDPADEVRIVLLGDLIDRGPDSAGVLRRARDWQKSRAVDILAGNHEDMFLDAFTQKKVLRHFVRHGGRETLLSFPIDKDEYEQASLEELRDLMNARVPKDDRDFVAGFRSFVEIGDYVFVHAGIKPGVPIAEQSRRDLLWIRERFLTHSAPHERMVVHGHTISREIDERSNRIGIDTGAFCHGRLTALVLEGESRRYIQAVADKDDVIAIEHRG